MQSGTGGLEPAVGLLYPEGIRYMVWHGMVWYGVVWRGTMVGYSDVVQ